MANDKKSDESVVGTATITNGVSTKRVPTGAEINGKKVPAVLRFESGRRSSFCLSMTKAYETFPDDWDTYWEAVETTLRIANEQHGMLRYITARDGVKSFVGQLRAHFETNGIYDIIRSKDRLVQLNILEKSTPFDMVTYDLPMSEVTRVMMPSSPWNLHIAAIDALEG